MALILVTWLRLSGQFELYNGTDSLLRVRHSRNSRLEIGRQLGGWDRMRRFCFPMKYGFHLLEYSFQGSLGVEPPSLRYFSYCKKVRVPARNRA
jgi:hypothetical protein